MESLESVEGPLGETLAAFGESGVPLTTTEVADAVECSRRTAYDRLERLVECGAVETKKVGARGRVWWRPPADRAGSDGRDGDGPARSDSPDEAATPTDDGREPPCEAAGTVAGTCVPVAALDAADVAAVVLDEDFEVAWANEAVERYFGVDRDALVGREGRSVVRETIADVVADGDQFAETLLPASEDGRADPSSDDRDDPSSDDRDDPSSDDRDDPSGDRNGPETFECRVTPGPDREERWLEHHSRPVESGQFAGGRVEVYYDVTDRKRSERALEAERDRIERVVETSPIAVFAADGSTVEANAQAAELLGVPANDVEDYELGQAELRDESGAVVPYEERPIAQVLRTGEPVSDVTLQTTGTDGEPRWMSLDATPLTDDAGAVTHVVATGADVTDLKEQSRRLERQRDDLERQRDDLESELNEVLERVTDAVYALDDRWRFTYVNDRAETIFGRDASELLGREIWEVFPEGEPLARERFERAMDSQEPVQFETSYEPADVWVEVAAYPSESGLSVYFRDVSERTERERELERYETVIETVRDGIYAHDPDGRFTMVNEAFLEMSGYDREEIIGAHSTLVHSEAVDEQALDLAMRSDDTEADARDEGPTLEFGLQRRDGDSLPVESRFEPYEYEGETAFTGVVRDVSERRQFERTLTALHDTSRTLFEAETTAEVSEVVVDAASDTIDLTGVAVYRYDEAADALVADAASFARPVFEDGIPPAPVDGSSITGLVHAEGESRQFDDVRNSPHLYPDVEDSPIRGGLFVPMADYGVLVAGSEAVGGIDERTRHLVELLAATAAAAYERVEREQELRCQRDRLQALDDLNAVVRGINEALVEQSSREEVARVVCERLAASESYEFAWFGDVDPKRGVVRSEVEVGVEDYLPDVPVSTDPDDDVFEGPIDRAVRTHEVQVVDDALDDPAFEPWREYAREYGYRSAAVVPVVHEGTLYGVVGVYGVRPGAFAGEQRAAIGQLRTVVGHAIAAIDRKRALMSDEVVAVEFRIPDVFETVGAEPVPDATIRFEHAVTATDGRYLVYGTADAAGVGGLRALVDRQDHWEELSVLDRERDAVAFEVRIDDPPVVSLVAAHGGYLEEATVEDGDHYMTLHLPPGGGVRQVIDAVEDVYPAGELLLRRRVTRTGGSVAHRWRTLAGGLTDRQRAALDAAYYSGYFEWPRDSSGEDVADSLGVSAPTFHQHVRHAQRKLLDALYGGEGPLVE